MRKKLWEMAVGILYILILVYQVTKVDNVKVTCEFPSHAVVGNRVRAVFDISGCRGKSLALKVAYDGGRLIYCGRAGGNPPEGSFIFVRESGTEEERILEISALVGEEFLDRGSIILEFYVKREYEEIPVKVKLCRGGEKKLLLPD
ncbi:MAG: hypothetical protein NC307_05400 [Roseburia sp.]|nr:hypothetical protein [Roseburia sp.]